MSYLTRHYKAALILVTVSMLCTASTAFWNVVFRAEPAPARLIHYSVGTFSTWISHARGLAADLYVVIATEQAQWILGVGVQAEPAQSFEVEGWTPSTGAVVRVGFPLRFLSGRLYVEGQSWVSDHLLRWGSRHVQGLEYAGKIFTDESIVTYDGVLPTRVLIVNLLVDMCFWAIVVAMTWTILSVTVRAVRARAGTAPNAAMVWSGAAASETGSASSALEPGGPPRP